MSGSFGTAGFGFTIARILLILPLVFAQMCDGCDGDRDGDGYAGSDCDDSDAGVHPGAEERCNGIDDDCDGDVDEEEDGQVLVTYFRDLDADGWGVRGVTWRRCARPPGFTARAGDCDDENELIHPDAQEVCDVADVDEDCDGLADNLDDGAADATRRWFSRDEDGDGYGDRDGERLRRCDPPSEAWGPPLDCDDADLRVKPGATERCDGIDNDCDGAVDHDPDGEIREDVYYRDLDEDGYGDRSSTVRSCIPVTGYVSRGGDCDDGDPDVYPGAPEWCDGRRQDCRRWRDETTPEIGEPEQVEAGLLTYQLGEEWSPVEVAEGRDGVFRGDALHLKGGTLHVCPGVFGVHLTITERRTRISGRYPDSAIGAVLDGEHARRLVDIREGGDAVFRDITLARGFHQERGGAISCVDATLSSTRLTIRDSSVPAGDGGAVFAEDCSLQLRPAIFLRNKANRGGAIYATSKLDRDDPYAGTAIGMPRFVENEAAEGGSLYVNGRISLRWVASMVFGSRAPKGAVLVARAGARVHFIDSIIRGADARGLSGTSTVFHVDDSHLDLGTGGGEMIGTLGHGAVAGSSVTPGAGGAVILLERGARVDVGTTDFGGNQGPVVVSVDDSLVVDQVQRFESYGAAGW